MTEPNHSFNDVPALVEERRRYDAWLAALEARRESTAVHVFDRVKADYQARLQRVDEQLVAHRQAIEEERTSSQTRLSLIAADEQLHRDERAELELRSHVGELAGAEADAAFHAVDETIRQLVEQKNAVTARIAELNALINFKPVAAVPPAPEAPPAETAADDRAATKGGTVATPGGTFDEMAFLSEVVGEEARRAAETAPQPKPSAPAAAPVPVAAPPVVAAPVVAAPVVAAPVVAAPIAAPVAAAPRVAGPPVVAPPIAAPPAAAPPPSAQPWATVTGGPQSTGAPNRAGNGIGAGPGSGIVRSAEIGEPPRAPLGPRRSATGTAAGPAAGGMRRDEPAESLLAGMDNPPRRGLRDAPLAANVPSNTPIVLRATGAVEQTKSLKCNECGALNYPTEWYCERCGAELAAL